MTSSPLKLSLVWNSILDRVLYVQQRLSATKSRHFCVTVKFLCTAIYKIQLFYLYYRENRKRGKSESRWANDIEGTAGKLWMKNATDTGYWVVLEEAFTLNNREVHAYCKSKTNQLILLNSIKLYNNNRIIIIYKR